MRLRRLGSAALLAAVTASPVAAAAPVGTLSERRVAREQEEPGSTRDGRHTDLLRRVAEAPVRPVRVAQTGVSRQGPVFARPGDWAHAEAAVVVGSQLVNQDLGYSSNIFQTVSAAAEDVGFGQHYGARGAFFLNRYLGAEAGFARTTTEFDFSVVDEEAGVTFFDEPLTQVSQEGTVSAVAQWPRAALTPYAVIGYAWRTSEVEGGDSFQAGAVIVGFGIKVPFPQIPVSLAFDYRYFEYGTEDGGGLQLAEGGMGRHTVSALTLGVVVRLNVNR